MNFNRKKAAQPRVEERINMSEGTETKNAGKNEHSSLDEAACSVYHANGEMQIEISVDNLPVEMSAQRWWNLAHGLRQVSRPMNYMTDCDGARRMYLMWVPKKFSRWKKCSWGFCAGRLWVQFTPPER